MPKNVYRYRKMMARDKKIGANIMLINTLVIMIHLKV